MARFVARRVLMLLPLLILVTILVFGFLQLTGVDPVRIVLGDEYTPEQAALVRRQLGLDRPLAFQYVSWLTRVLRGDLGRSFVQLAPVTSLMLDRIPTTVWLTVTAMAVSLGVAIPVGVLSATRKNTPVDGVVRVIALAGHSVPGFWLGLLLILLFSLKLRLLPPGGSIALYGWKALVLPAVALGTSLAAVITRLVRSSLLEVLSLEYIRTARAKGLPERLVVYRHGLKNALLPVMTVVGLQFGALLGGTVLTESVFAMPGLGRLLVDSIHRKDYPVVQACVLWITSFFLLLNLTVDLTYAYVDPRIRYS